MKEKVNFYISFKDAPCLTDALVRSELCRTSDQEEKLTCSTFRLAQPPLVQVLLDLWDGRGGGGGGRWLLHDNRAGRWLWLLLPKPHKVWRDESEHTNSMSLAEQAATALPT